MNVLPQRCSLLVRRGGCEVPQSGAGPLLDRLGAVDVDANAGEGARESSRERAGGVEVDVGAVGRSRSNVAMYSSHSPCLLSILNVLCSFVFRIVDIKALRKSRSGTLPRVHTEGDDR